MAREVIERLIDDLDGGDAAETVSFALDSTTYEIDLSAKNAAALRKSLERYIGGARRQSGPRPARPRRTAPSPKRAKAARKGATSKRGFDLVQLRKWAGSNNVAVPARGRIPQAIVDQYKAAGGR